MAPAYTILSHLASDIENFEGIYCINISGESGCGKSTLALALEAVLKEKGLNAYIFHMDDYFILPPASNHQNRVLSFDNVGPHEVNLTLLQENIDDVKAGKRNIEKPLVHYDENKIEYIHVNLDKIKIILVEGTYTSLLQNVDTKIFIDRSYKDTLDQRRERAREPITPFIESVLDIEHRIISSHKHFASIIIDKKYQVHQVSI